MTTLQPSRGRSAVGAALAGVFVVLACGRPPADNSEDIAKAFAGPPAPASKKETAAQMKALEERAAADAAKARTDELETITTAPSQLPELEAGCADAAAAFDEFRQKRLTNAPDELARWNATKEPDLRKASDACKASGKPEIAACQASALRGASIGHFGIDAANELTEACAKRYGGGAAPPAMQ
ncbi:MAG TPA: hypothetical protein VFG69_06250 [Nannocystaceae bacterium]|nr:hypothetical protein [Nannocystaceae bacterium]